jgi:uncharacterized protein YndB with AHSA1/START domain
MSNKFAFRELASPFRRLAAQRAHRRSTHAGHRKRHFLSIIGTDCSFIVRGRNTLDATLSAEPSNALVSLREYAMKKAAAKKAPMKKAAVKKTAAKKAGAKEKPALMSDQAVQAKTGKTWPEWFAILDKAGARELDHKGIVAYLVKQHDVGPWWQQMVTVNYERARGMREVHQKPTGYSISRSKTLAVPLEQLFEAWSDAKARAGWLEEKKIVVRKATPHKSIRIAWPDGTTVVEVGFYEKGGGKNQVSVQHDKLADARAAERMKAYWGDQLERLERWLNR